MLVRERAQGWLFGGYTAVGFRAEAGEWSADPAAFLFSLVNREGVAARFADKGTAYSVYSDPNYGATFGNGCDLYICSNADTTAGSSTNLGDGYAVGAGGPHQMSGGIRGGWLVAEVAAFVIPQ